MTFQVFYVKSDWLPRAALQARDTRNTIANFKHRHSVKKYQVWKSRYQRKRFDRLITHTGSHLWRDHALKIQHWKNIFLFKRQRNLAYKYHLIPVPSRSHAGIVSIWATDNDCPYQRVSSEFQYTSDGYLVTNVYWFENEDSALMFKLAHGCNV